MVGSKEHLKPFRFVPGKSGNPSGRSKGHHAAAREGAKLTDNGVKLMQFAWRVLNKEEPGMTSSEDRRWAWQMLADRTMGKPQFEIDIAPEQPRTSWDFSKLTLEELEIFEPLLDKVRRLNTGEPGPPLSTLLPSPPNDEDA